MSCSHFRQKHQIGLAGAENLPNGYLRPLSSVCSGDPYDLGVALTEELYSPDIPVETIKWTLYLR